MLRRGQFRRCGRAEPAPPRGGPSRARWPTGKRSEMTRRAIFSEGRNLRARVVRLDASQGMSPSPAHWREHGGKKTPHSGWRHALLCGRVEPAPPRVDHPGRDGLAVESPEMAPKAVFSEGRTLCVRIARPCPCRGISLVEMVGRTAPGLTGMCLVQAQACFNGRAEPAPPLGG